VLKVLTDFIKSVARSAHIHHLTLAMSQPGALVNFLEFSVLQKVKLLYQIVRRLKAHPHFTGSRIRNFQLPFKVRLSIKRAFPFPWKVGKQMGDLFIGFKRISIHSYYLSNSRQIYTIFINSEERQPSKFQVKYLHVGGKGGQIYSVDSSSDWSGNSYRVLIRKILCPSGKSRKVLHPTNKSIRRTTPVLCRH
jgi:hypothetical protein